MAPESRKSHKIGKTMPKKCKFEDFEKSNLETIKTGNCKISNLEFGNFEFFKNLKSKIF